MSTELEVGLVEVSSNADTQLARLSSIFHANHDQAVIVPIRSLVASDSPRLAGESTEHSRALAESGADLPPIIVQRSLMRVIDGMHRLHAAAMRGEHEIAVLFFDGSDDDAFLLAVKANIAHGLPLSLADRKAAAERIIAAHWRWSDRAVASVTGLAHQTVAAIRRRATGEVAQLHARVGRDGRVRPLNGAEGRRLAGELFATNPGASLREIARAAGVSPGTARDVRGRLLRGEDSVLPRQQARGQRVQPREQTDRQRGQSVTRKSADEKAALVRNLKKDPSLRFTEAGRVLLRLIDAHTMQQQDWDRLVAAVPRHLTAMVAEMSRECIAIWHYFTDQIEVRDKVGREDQAGAG